jgi:hypothetical protein
VSESEREDDKMEEASLLCTHGRIRTALSTRPVASTGVAGSAAHSAERAVIGAHCPRVTQGQDRGMVRGSKSGKRAADRWAHPS